MNFFIKDQVVYAFDDQQVLDGLADGMDAMTPEEVEAHINPSLESSPPNVVTMRQARLALFGAGLLGGVESAIDALEEPQRTAARIEWDYSSEVYRNKPFVAVLSQSLGLSEHDLDGLFLAASAL